MPSTANSFETGMTIGMMIGGKKAKLKTLNVKENGIFKPTEEDNCDGWNEVNVDVDPVLRTLNVSENGTYEAPDDIDGYDTVNVDVDPVINSLYVTENGTYTAPDGVDGYNPVEVNVKTYKEEYEEMKSIVEFLKQSDTDDSDTIDVMMGTSDISDVETEKHTFTFKVQYVRFMSGVTQGIGSIGDKYEVNILIYRDGEYLFTQRTTINARTEDSVKEDGYGVDQLASCFYWSTSESGIPVLNYRYYALGSWASYDQWNQLSMYNYMD